MKQNENLANNQLYIQKYKHIVKYIYLQKHKYVYVYV